MMISNELPTRAEDMFCYAIYTASHLVNRAYTPHLSKLGLTYPKYITLTLLWDRDSQKVTELAATLRMATSTLTPLLKRLEEQGLVKRSRGEKDGREIYVNLTKAGFALKDEAPSITACMVQSTTLNKEELNELQMLLSKLCKGLAA